MVCCGERELEGLSVNKLTQLEACCYLVGAGDWATGECEVQNMYTCCCDTHVVMYSAGVPQTTADWGVADYMYPLHM